MKKKLLFILTLLIFPLFVNADNINSVSMNIYINENGSMDVTETWQVVATSGSEWYKEIANMGDSAISNFVVYMDGTELKYKKWNISESLEEKGGYYGIINKNNSVELCFGKSDYKPHTFTLKYNISNVIFNTSDAQVFYWTLVPNNNNTKFNAIIDSYYEFPDTLDVWGYGNDGYAYVENGKIYLEDYLTNEKVILLAKFPSNTFNTTYKTEYETFDDVLNVAEEGASRDYTTHSEKTNKYLAVFNEFLYYFGRYGLFLIAIVIIISRKKKNKFESIKVPKYNYKYENNKEIKKEKARYFRDIPCNKNIYYADVLLKINKYSNNKSNIVGAIILKWVKEGCINFITTEASFNRKKSKIIFIKEPTDSNEKKLYSYMKIAAKDEELTIYELERWSKKHFDIYLNCLYSFDRKILKDLKEKNLLIKKDNCKTIYVHTDKLYDESTKLYGLKRYLDDFSSMKTKTVLDVKLWDEYLMFAYLFGNANKVIKQLKNIYPELPEINNINYDTLKFVSDISDRSYHESRYRYNRIQARNSSYDNYDSDSYHDYSSGGGGHSSSGGGSGSFGSGGSMGGR